MSYFQTNLHARGDYGNHYFTVTQPFEVLECVGHVPSNAYYGASRLYDPVYRRLTLTPGNIIMDLVGGLFMADAPGATCRPVCLHPNPKSHFEKRYAPDRHEWPLDKLAATGPMPYVHAGDGRIFDEHTRFASYTEGGRDYTLCTARIYEGVCDA